LVILAVVSTTVVQLGVARAQVASGATLTVLRGTVGVVRGNGSAVQPASSGLVLSVGDRVATIGRASALVTFFEGSELELGGDTTIAIQEMDSKSGGQVNIVVENVLGSTVNRIATLTNPGSSYEIVAGGTVALVRGTTIGHRVDGNGNITVYLIKAI
jgi:hypothetical protein